MIAQATATYHASRVRSLTSLASTPIPSLRINGLPLRSLLTSFRVMRKNSTRP